LKLDHPSVAGQKRRVTAAIKCDLRRRSAVEPCIGHLKSEHCMGRSQRANRSERSRAIGILHGRLFHIAQIGSQTPRRFTARRACGGLSQTETEKPILRHSLTHSIQVNSNCNADFDGATW
jgi:hypothetical protein